MVSQEASAEVLMELSDEQSVHDGVLVRVAAGMHAVDSPSANNWVYVCPPSWNVTPREFAAACHYSLQDGTTWQDAVGGVLGVATTGIVLTTPTTGLTAAICATALPAIVGLPGSVWLQRRMARMRVERMKNAGLSQVLEVARDEFDGDHMFHTDLANAEALKPGEMTAARHQVLTRLWLSAGGDPAIADTLPDKGWVSRASRKRDSHWANRAIMNIVSSHQGAQKRLDDLEQTLPDTDPCNECDSVWHDADDHRTYNAAVHRVHDRNKPPLTQFSYVALSHDGKRVSGDVEAANKGVVDRVLKANGMMPLSVTAPTSGTDQEYSYTAVEPGTGRSHSGTAKASSAEFISKTLTDSGLASVRVAPVTQPNPFAPTVLPTTEATARPAPRPTTMAGRWADALARFEVVEKEWENIVTDPMAALDHAALLDMSLMPDGSMTRTGVFVEAFGKAQDLQRRHVAHSPAGGPEDRADVIEFEDAVRAAHVAWTEAKRWAKSVGIDALPESERDIARRARKSLAIAMDDRTSIEHAITAAETAARLLKSIHSVAMPEPTMLQIETKARKAIG